MSLGYYYLCDAGYMNSEGFLTPFRGQRYHLNEWRQGREPQTAKEYYNMKHSRARNVIERCFGLLKLRWGILRCATWYPVKTMCRIISACALLHNFIRMNIEVDPLEMELDRSFEQEEGPVDIYGEDLIAHLESNSEWNSFRLNLSNEMFQMWRQNRHN